MVSSTLYSVLLAIVLISVVTLSTAQLSPESAAEGTCLSPPAQTSLVAWTFIFGNLNPWYIPMAHEYFYRQYAKTLLGRPAADETELAEMNLKLQCVTSACIASGFGNTSLSVTPLFEQTCVATSFNILNPALISQLTCVTVPLSFGSLSAIVIWTDSATALLLGLCINGERAFTVLSKNTELSESVTSSITSALVQNGYSANYFQNLPNW